MLNGLDIVPGKTSESVVKLTIIFLKKKAYLKHDSTGVTKNFDYAKHFDSMAGAEEYIEDNRERLLTLLQS